jgi:hypothetical protein
MKQLSIEMILSLAIAVPILPTLDGGGPGVPTDVRP